MSLKLVEKSIPTWLVCRLDTQVDRKMVDVYLLVDKDSEFVLAMDIIEDTITELQTKELVKKAELQAPFPPQIFLAYGDPIKEHLSKICKIYNINLIEVFAAEIDKLTLELRKKFSEICFSPSSIVHIMDDDNLGEHDDTKEAIAASIPDSYAPCPCNSGKKYKFCCKRIFREVVEAMAAIEKYDFEVALDWLDQAEKIVGITAETLCRKAIIYSYSDDEKSNQYLTECINKFPEYPRAYYVQGLMFSEAGDDTKAILSYKKAISLYPSSDPYHINEAYNNLGIVFHRVGDLDNAKKAWHQALFYIPSDKYAKNNIIHFFGHEALRIH